jgi:hypothetical protein
VASGVGGGAGRRRRGQRDGGRRSFAGGTHSRVSGLGFVLGLAQKVARVTGNQIGGLRRSVGGRRQRPAVSGGVERRRACWRMGKVGRENLTSWDASLPHGEASRAHGR